MPKESSALVVPALKARMGDWNYYLGFMRFADVVERIRVAEEIHAAQALRELLQRGLQDRAGDIAEYLRMQPQRFFNSLVVGSYGGRPEWYEVDLKPSAHLPLSLPDYVHGAIGLLVLSGDETLFAIDGQHRIVGMRKALEHGNASGEEEVGVLFVKGVSASNREADPQGFERTRRLFTTLSSRAKSVSK